MKPACLLCILILTITSCNNDFDRVSRKGELPDRPDGNYLLLSTNQIKLSSDPNSVGFSISSNVNWEIEVPESLDWIGVNKTSGVGDAIIFLDVKENTDQTRYASIFIKTEVFINALEIIQVDQDSESW